MDESMKAATTAAKEEGKAASRLYNVPIETLCRRVTSSVDANCRPGPPTILTSEEEDKLAEYCVEMADRGFGLDVMRFAFQIAERTKKAHPFQNRMAGRG